MERVIDLRNLLEDVNFQNFIDFWSATTGRTREVIIEKLESDDMFREIFYERYLNWV